MDIKQVNSNFPQQSPDTIEIPTSLDRVWIFKYIVQIIGYLDLSNAGKPITEEVYGFCIGPTFQAAATFLESYFGDDLDKICCLEPVNAVTPIARSYDDWTEIAESLSWDSKKLKPYIA